MIDVERINFLAKKQKTEGLTDEEIKEQKVLRQAYIDAIKRNIIGQLGDPELYKKNKDKN